MTKAQDPIKKIILMLVDRPGVKAAEMHTRQRDERETAGNAYGACADCAGDHVV